jgi:flavodoxin
MMVLVLYSSKGGNTRKLAERIGEGAESVSGVYPQGISAETSSNSVSVWRV